MAKFSANLSMMFGELPMIERVGAARAAGFDGVEIQFPYDIDAAALGAEIGRHGLTLTVINAPPPNYAGGPRGFAAVPGGEDRFRHDFRRAARNARALGARHLHVMAGAAEGAAARATFVANLAHAAAEAPGLSLVIEPINRHDMPGYFLADFALAAEILAEVGAPNLRMQFDAYHAHRITGDVFAAWDSVRHLVAHVQVAGHPGRNEPDSGEIDFSGFLARLKADGYGGWIGAEYTPRDRTESGLGWLAAAQRAGHT